MDEFFAKLDALYGEGDQEKIQAHLQGTLAQLRAKGEEGALDAASVLNEMGGYYRGVSRYEDALRVSEEAREILLAHGMGETVQFATMLLNDAGTLRLMCEPEKSYEEYQTAKALLERLGETGSYPYVSLLNNLSLTCMDMGRTDEAIEMAEVSLELVRQRPDREDEVPTSLNNLAAMLLNLNRLEEAEARAREALAEFALLPEKSAHEAAAYGTLGVILFGSGRTDEAAAAFQTAAEGTEAVFGRNADYVSAKRSLSVCRQKLGDKDGAESALQDAYDAAKALFGEFHPRTQTVGAALRRLREQA